jgi:hypothetical protein
MEVLKLIKYLKGKNKLFYFEYLQNFILFESFIRHKIVNY